MSNFKENQRKGFKYSRQLIRRVTKHEQILKDELDKQDIYYKFQAYFHDHEKLYIPDFRLATRSHKLIIEVDGESHKRQEEYDQKRTIWLYQDRNCTVLRFTNEQIENNIDSVIKKILNLNPLTKTKREKNIINSKFRKNTQEERFVT